MLSPAQSLCSPKFAIEPSGPAKDERYPVTQRGAEGRPDWATCTRPPGEPVAERDPGSAFTPASGTAQRPALRGGELAGPAAPAPQAPPGTHHRPRARPLPARRGCRDPNLHPNPAQVLFCPDMRSPPSKGLVWGPHILGRTGSIALLFGMSWDKLHPPRHRRPGHILWPACSSIPEKSFWAPPTPAAALGVRLSYSRQLPQGGLHLGAASRSKRHCSKKETWENARISPASPALPRGFGKAQGEVEPPHMRRCGLWKGTALLSATQGWLQEIPALQHFLRTPRGREASMEKPDAVFHARLASAPMAGWSARGARGEPRRTPLGDSSAGGKTTKMRKPGAQAKQSLR